MQDGLEGGNLRMKSQGINDLIRPYAIPGNDIVAWADPINFLPSFHKLRDLINSLIIFH